MMIAKYFTASIISLLSFRSASVLGFVVPTYNNAPPTSSLLSFSSAAPVEIKSLAFRSLQMANGGDDDDGTDDNKNKFQKNLKKATASIFAAAFIFSMSIPAPAIAATASSLADNTNSYSFSVIDSSSQIVAARRSGGRAGGRARPAMRSRSSSSRTVINRNTYISPPSRSVYVAPPVYGGGFGYNPYGGLGLGLGLNAIGNVGRDIQDYRQEGEIRDTRVELEKSRMREAELESRLRQLEQGQAGFQQQQQFQQMQQQQQAANAAAAAAVTK